MSYVPGFTNDVFISYAHGDDYPPLTPDGRGWVSHFADRFSAALRQRLGCPPSVFIDRRDLAKYVDYDRQLHDDLDSAILIAVVSPSYSRSDYCLRERDAFVSLVKEKHAQKFRNGALANAQFIFKVVSLSDDEQSHRRVLPELNLSDIPFFEGEGDRSRRLGVERPGFTDSIEQLAIEACGLLKKMRAQCVPVFLWPRDCASPEISALRTRLADELSDASFRVLPEFAGNSTAEIGDAELAIFLLESGYDPEAERLVGRWADRNKPWVVWRSGRAKHTEDEAQAAFIARCVDNNDPLKTFLEENCSLKEEILQLLKSGGKQTQSSRKRVYLMYNPEDPDEEMNAACVLQALQRRCEVETPGEFSAHRRMLMTSHGVLLLWGTAKPEWYKHTFVDMSKFASGAVSQGVCFFDPKGNKSDALARLRALDHLHVIEQFDGFDPRKLEPFLERLQ